MEVNKEQAERCLELAEIYLKINQLAKVQKLLEKSQSLYPLPKAAKLFKLLELRKRAGNHEESKPSEPKANVDYTQEQADVVKRVQKCKDFYEVLGVTQSTPDTEIKKCYKKLALQLHPDKNKAPGAMEAFKSLGNAVETLTDPAKRKAYDLYRTTAHGSPSEGRSRGMGRGYSYEHVPDMNANDLFSAFFGGAFAQQQQHQHHYYRARNNRGTQYGEGTGQSNLFYLVILMGIVVSVLSTFFASDPLYSLQHTNKYSVERRTLNLKIPYYVKSNFLNEYQGSLGRLEHSVEEEYVSYMKRTCSNERAYRDAMIGRAKSFGSRAQFQQAQQLKMPSCEALYRLGIGVVHY